MAEVVGCPGDVTEVLGGGEAEEVVRSAGDVAEVVNASVGCDGGVVGRGVGAASVGTNHNALLSHYSP